jgi:sporulation protein YlmC with PRC-barrel domain
MDISLNVTVQCTDGVCGQSTCVIVNPIKKQVTHVVVREAWFPHTEYLVPLDLVSSSTPEMIHLRFTKDELKAQNPYIEVEYIRGDLHDFNYEDDNYMMWPYITPEEEGNMPMEIEKVPPGELAVRRGSHVAAKDGRVGQVDEFLVDPVSEHITHLILREGHLWGQKDVTIPVSEIARIEEDTVYLKLTTSQVEILPAIPVRRQYKIAKE